MLWGVQLRLIRTNKVCWALRILTETEGMCNLSLELWKLTKTRNETTASRVKFSIHGSLPLQENLKASLNSRRLETALCIQNGIPKTMTPVVIKTIIWRITCNSHRKTHIGKSGSIFHLQSLIIAMTRMASRKLTFGICSKSSLQSDISLVLLSGEVWGTLHFSC